MENEQKQQKKQLKKAYKKARRKSHGLWKALTILSVPLAIILILATVVISTFDNTLALVTGDTFWKLENADASAVYYAADFTSDEERLAAGYDTVYRVESEGATLLMNENEALPLSEGEKVSTFSTSSVSIIYGGSGSGNVDTDDASTLKEALENSGLQVNETLWNFYLEEDNAQYQRENTDDYTVSEMPWSVYTEEVLNSVATYGDAVIVTLSRTGGEGGDLEFQEYNYLALDDNEKEMLSHLKEMKDNGVIGKIIVLINTSNPLQVDFLKEKEYGVDAAFWIGGVGDAGIDAVADILVGNVNPSGSLVDTYCYDNYSSAAMKNNIATYYVGYDAELLPENAGTYMVYQEGIYVGYKYYETRYEDYVMGTGNAGDYIYGNDVAFPFGYGLSYTTFEYSDMTLLYDEVTTTYTINITVTNTGDTYAGKETMQIYVSSPYTDYDVENGVEKASVSLVGFDKTQILAPGEKETLTIEIDGDYVASFDTYGAGTYILDAGDYYFTAATDAHNAVNNVLAAKGYTPENTDGRMDAAGDVSLTVVWNNPALDTTTYALSDNGTQITNCLSQADLNLNENVAETVNYLTRNDWVGTLPSGEMPVITMNEYLLEGLQDVQYDAEDYDGATMAMPTLGADNGLRLYDMIGLDYDNPQWEDLLDQLTFDEMVSLIGDAFHWTMPVESVNAPGTRCENGPQGLTVNLFGFAVLEAESTGLTTEDVLAATFNTDLAAEVGEIVGEDCLAANISMLYGPGANTHRTPYGGRSYEYFSEDAVLTSEISEAEVKAIQENGVLVQMKHLALNDSEQSRLGLSVWLNEQTAREIYLRAFQGALESSQGAGNGVMSAYTRWGTTWSGAFSGLMVDILQKEWGCFGLQITDNVEVYSVNGLDGVMNGTTAFDAMYWYVTELLNEYKDDPMIINAMREACHHNLYAIANSAAMNGIGENTTVKAVTPKIVAIPKAGAVVFSALFVISLVMWIVKARKFRKSEIYMEYHKLPGYIDK